VDVPDLHPIVDGWEGEGLLLDGVRIGHEGRPWPCVAVDRSGLLAGVPGQPLSNFPCKVRQDCRDGCLHSRWE
jgi:hypothetical protein